MFNDILLSSEKYIESTSDNYTFIRTEQNRYDPDLFLFGEVLNLFMKYDIYEKLGISMDRFMSLDYASFDTIRTKIKEYHEIKTSIRDREAQLLNNLIPK